MCKKVSFYPDIRPLIELIPEEALNFRFRISKKILILQGSYSSLGRYSTVPFEEQKPHVCLFLPGRIDCRCEILIEDRLILY
ncbi:MAG: hypothetical protein N2513_09340 [Deltaproteobacteria bacterium]|nr:hypothetical protein [Deltaproteobacteria bacterium]